MKKNDWILLGLGAVVLILGLFIYQDKSEKILYKLNGEAGVHNVTYSEYVEKINSNEPFIVVIIREGCHYCELYEPLLTDAVNELKIPVYMIDTATLESAEINALSSSNNYLQGNTSWGTPTTILLKGTQDIGSINGYVEKDKIIDFVKKYIDLSDGE